jgi:aryl-alcohol dehydrogenase-like predicted oxidoreductase
MSEESLSRRDAIKVGIGAGAALVFARQLHAFPTAQQSPMIMRAIPSSGEKVPVIGMGTAVIYQDPKPEDIPALRETLKAFPELGGRVLDTAPSYGRAESVVGDLLAELKNRDKYFLATKVSVGRNGGDRSTAEAQMEESLRRFKTDKIDLMQIWNVSNPTLLASVLDEWKKKGRIRYTGITSSMKNAYPALEAAMKAYKYDFVQIDLAVDNRSAEERIIPLAKDLGMGVLVNSPFGRNRVLSKVMSKPLPDFAKEIDAETWPQLVLKWIVGNPAVTAVIPGIGRVDYLKDDLNGGRGRLPDAAMRKRIEGAIDSIA